MLDLNTTSTTPDESLIQQIQPYFNKWWWFIVSSLVLLSVAVIYLRYSTNIYQAEASILIKDTQAGGGISELAALGDLGMLGNSFNSVENEIEVLSSRRLMSKVVEELNLDIQYFNEGNVKTSESFQSASFKIIKSSNTDVIDPFQFYVQRISSTEVKYWEENSDDTQTAILGEPIPFDQEVILTILDAKRPIKETESKEAPIYLIKVSGFESSVVRYANKLTVDQSVKRGSVIDLSISDPVPTKTAAILNQLIVEYNKDATQDKNIVAQNTVNFIEDRLATIELSLDSVELKKQQFKQENSISDIVAEATMNLESSAEYTAKQIEAQTQLRIARDLRTYLSNLGEDDYIPANLTLDSGSINQSINEYNELLLTLNQRRETATELNPLIQELQSRLTKLKGGISASLNSYIQSLETRLGSILSQNNRLSRRIGEVPSTERTARDIERDQTIVEAIYLYLFQKKEETAISLAVTAPKAKIVDSALVADQPISPKPSIILLGALIVGLLIPFAFIYLKGLFYDKIENRKDVTRKLPSVPFLGEVPKLASDEADKIAKNDRSVLAESFRILRTNLQYKIAALEKTDKAPIIIVTSSVKGEGKTFVSFNLAMTMANSGKKVLLLGGDIRNPQLHRYLQKGSKSLNGVTEFLVYPEYKAEEFIHTSDDNENLHIMLSGAIPPNPAELWLSDRVEDLLDYARNNYDLVIIDSAPSMLVTDTLLISDKADVTVYVSRANYTEKPLLDFVSDTIESGKLKNVAIVLNNVKIANFGYGNKYAYSYGVDQDTTWEKFLKAIKLKK
ncbi:GumC family protein [Nonlabens marinus]|uniref:non-specific protein-tyrosine kinase n=1 Tax=Nonlabens marinus S1-08 TaxID=1454201 RepID=W8VXY2_9FLAO|nr:polysaccharide biosynthesis tyrosine autokinase [Nonlabens marinus]BAO56722.1 tyrosine-protein kinase Wzc [Nonlabens marinus S1-08]